MSIVNELNVRRNVVTSVVAFGVNILLTFVTFRLVIAQGGTEMLGLWSALTAAIFIIRLGDVGMGSATERFIAATDAEANPDKPRLYLDTALIMNAFLFLSLAVIGWFLLSANIGIVVPGSEAQKKEAVRVLPIMLSGFVLSNIAGVVISALRGIHLVWLGSWLTVIGGVVQLILVIFLVPSSGIEGLATAQLIQHLTVGLLAWFVFNQSMRSQATDSTVWFPLKGSTKCLRELFSFSLRAQFVNLVNGLFEPVSKLLVGHTAGLTTLGLYEIAYKAVSLPRNAVVAGVMSTMPAMTKLVATNLSEAALLYSKSKKLVALGSASVLGVVVLASPILSYFVLGRIETTLSALISIIAVGYWFNAWGAPAYTLGFATGRLKGNITSAIISVSTLLILNFGLELVITDYSSVIAVGIALSVGGLIVMFSNQSLLRGSTVHG